MTNQEKYLKNYQQLIHFLHNTVNHIENDLKRVKTTINQLNTLNPYDESTWDAVENMLKEINPHNLQSYFDSEKDENVIEGIFDGYFMIGSDQKKYPIPANYSSKSKLVGGDQLMVKVFPDGKMIYKLVKPIERKHMKATLSVDNDSGKPIAITSDKKTYLLNQAAVSYYKADAGDALTIIVAQDDSSSFAALESVIKAAKEK
ncbi:MAG: hypothetical protein H6766_01775 [Candidatus Peribacteria bacterium]|nr:MAG: hypothetical protein H6766_01775 [Candidatus Peribacteria bacterium]